MCTPYDDLDFSDLGYPIFADDCDPWGDLDTSDM